MNAEQAYLFRHALLRDSAYQLHLPSERSRLHRLAMEIIESIAGVEPPELPDDLVQESKREICALDPMAGDLAAHARLASACLEGNESQAMLRREAVYLWRAAHHADASFRFEEAVRCWTELAANPCLSPLQRAGARVNAGRRLSFDHPRSALPLIQEILSEAESRPAVDARWTRVRVVALNALWRVRSSEGNGELARSAVEQAVKLADESGEPSARGLSWGNRAYQDRRSGRIDAAERGFMQALKLFEEAGQSPEQANALTFLARLYGETGRFREAEDAVRRALALARRHGLRNCEAEAMAELAILQSNLGLHDAALNDISTSLSIAREIGNRQWERSWLNSLAIMQRHCGRLPEAQASFLAAVALSVEQGDNLNEAAARTNLGDLYRTQGRMKEAETECLIALTISIRGEDASIEGVANGILALVYKSTGRHEEARAKYREAISIFEKIGDVRRKGLWLHNYGEFLLEQGEVAESGRAWEEASSILSSIDAPALLEEMRRLQAAARAAHEERNRAR